MTFTDKQQKEHRAAFIEECRQKAWGAACHAEWIGKQLDDLTAEYQKIKANDDAFAVEIKSLETALDSHTYENRTKRKDLRGKRDGLVKPQNLLAENMRQGQKAMQQLYVSAEQNLALAAHADGWSWKEVRTENPLP
jgi:hypothetical protein